jgi:HAD superfamily hydrolase (TIGR01509 family)
MTGNVMPSGESPMPVRAVFFDLGETLIDETRMWAEWAAYLGVPAGEFMQALEETIARGEHHRRVFDRYRPNLDFAAARRERIASGTSYAYRPSDLYPDAAPCLKTLRSRGYFIAVAGNQPREALNDMLTLGLEADLMTTSTHLGHEKPAPEFFAALLSQTGFRPAEVAYVGDRVDNDVLPARAAGMTTVFIPRGIWGRIHAARGDAADIRIDALSELADALATHRETRP